MFSNTLEYCLDITIKEFNEFLKTRRNIKHTEFDLKNAFYQRMRANISSTSYWKDFQNLELRNILLNIENNILVGIRFKTNDNKYVKESFVNLLQTIINSIDFNKYLIYNSEYDNIILSINNFKIK